MNLGTGWSLLAVAAAVSAVLTAATRYYALRKSLLDAPGPRRSHNTPTPRGGGLGLVLTIILAGVVWLVRHHGENSSIAGCLAGLSLVAAIGWIDDHRSLPAGLRLAVHVVAAALAAGGLLGLPSTPVQWALLLMAVMWITGLVNAWNFMDGIDGLAITQAILLTVCALCGTALYGWLSGGWLDGSWIVLGALIGFLPFNFPKARIFLGDVGSGALGFLVACLLLRAIASGGMPWPLALVAVSAFGIDAALTLGKRIGQRKQWWRPHREHLYQWLVRRGRPHWIVTLAYLSWTAIACTLILIFGRSGIVASAWIAAGALSCACLLWLVARRQLVRR